jgi:hypothetical protein
MYGALIPILLYQVSCGQWLWKIRFEHPVENAAYAVDMKRPMHNWSDPKIFVDGEESEQLE